MLFVFIVIPSRSRVRVIFNLLFGVVKNMLGAKRLNEIEEIRKNNVRLKSRIPARIFAEIPRELRIAPEALNKRIEGAP